MLRQLYALMISIAAIPLLGGQQRSEQSQRAPLAAQSGLARLHIAVCFEPSSTSPDLPHPPFSENLPGGDHSNRTRRSVDQRALTNGSHFSPGTSPCSARC